MVQVGYPGDVIDDTFERLGLTFKTRVFGTDQVLTYSTLNAFIYLIKPHFCAGMDERSSAH